MFYNIMELKTTWKQVQATSLQTPPQVEVRVNRGPVQRD